MTEKGTRLGDCSTMVLLYAETPLHVGTQTDLSGIDLPIQREAGTALPMVQGSGLRGAFREQLSGHIRQEEQRKALFGPDPYGDPSSGDAVDQYASALTPLDGRLLLLPVRSACGGWAWVTSPLALARLVRGAALLGWQRIGKLVRDLGAPDSDEHALVAHDSGVVDFGGGPKKQTGEPPALILEETWMKAQTGPLDTVGALGRWLARLLPGEAAYEYFRKQLPRHLVVVSNTLFSHFCDSGTQVSTRIRVDDETGTVKDGGLWTEECLPAESVIWSVATFGKDRRRQKGESGAIPSEELQRAFQDALEARGGRIWLGGGRGVGHGLTAVALTSGTKEPLA